MRHLTVRQSAYHCVRMKTSTGEEGRFRTGAFFADEMDTSASTVSVSVSAGDAGEHLTNATQSKSFLRIAHRTRTLRYANLLFHVPLPL